MWLIVFFLFFVFLVYKSWYSPSFAIVYFLIFNKTTDMIANAAGISFSYLTLRYFFFMIILFRGAIFIRKSLVINKIILMGYLLLLFSILYYLLSINDSFNASRLQFTQDYMLFSLLPVTISIFVINNKTDLLEFSKAIIFFGIIFYLTIFLTGAFVNVDYTDRSTFFEEANIDSISLSRIAAIILVTAFCFVNKVVKKHDKIILLVVILFSVFYVFTAAQRGTIIGTCLSFLFYLYIKRNEINGKITTVLTFLLLLTVFLSNNKIITSVGGRFADLQNANDYERAIDYQTVYSIFSRNQFFYGLGPSGYLFKTGREFPHNFFLELTAEYGLLGIATFVFIILGAAHIIYNRLRLKLGFNHQIDFILMIWLMLFTSALVSGNIITNCLFFVFTFLLGMINKKLLLDINNEQTKVIVPRRVR